MAGKGSIFNGSYYKKSIPKDAFFVEVDEVV